MIASRAALVALALALASCGPSGRHAGTTLAMPEDLDARHLAIDELGERLHAALVAGAPLNVLLGDDELRALLSSESASRVAARRVAVRSRIGDADRVATLLAGTTYLGACLQDARDEPASGTLGLRADGWTFRRVLVAARIPGGRRIGTWIDGTFVLTDIGFGALDLERVEDPRWEHSDLDIAPCDMATALH